MAFKRSAVRSRYSPPQKRTSKRTSFFVVEKWRIGAWLNTPARSAEAAMACEARLVSEGRRSRIYRVNDSLSAVLIDGLSELSMLHSL